MHSLFLLCAFAVAPPSAHAYAKGPAVKVIVDVSDAPEAAEWGKKAGELATRWHPVVSRLLRSDGYTPPAEVRIVFKKNMKGVAFATGRTITISAKWIKDHPDDDGMVIHELTHVIQGYPGGGPSWLVEGIADYVRFTHFEPQTRVFIDPRRASYRDGYRTAGKFLAWAEKTHDKALVRKLNEALRTRKYRKELFVEYTSRTLDQLWGDFLAARERK